MSLPSLMHHPQRRLAVAAVTLGLLGAGTSCDGGAGSPVKFAENTATYRHFSGEEALRHTAALVAVGPRPSGSPEIEQARLYIESALGALGWSVVRHEFTDPTPGGPLAFTNLRARFAGRGGEADWRGRVAVLLGSHYDTKRYSSFPFVGANDGGSSTGLLIEAARALASNEALARQVELVFFDGEEALVSYGATDGLHGSRAYARLLRGTPPEDRPAAAVIFDMVGEDGFRATIPTNVSRRLAGHLFQAAADLGHRSRFGSHGSPILDDHVPLGHAGLEVVNIIDLDYAPWHTAGDTLDKLSAESLHIVGQTGLLLVEKYLLGGG
jgi:hypothetical protein